MKTKINSLLSILILTAAIGCSGEDHASTKIRPEPYGWITDGSSVAYTQSAAPVLIPYGSPNISIPVTTRGGENFAIIDGRRVELNFSAPGPIHLPSESYWYSWPETEFTFDATRSQGILFKYVDRSRNANQIGVSYLNLHSAEIGLATVAPISTSTESQPFLLGEGRYLIRVTAFSDAGRWSNGHIAIRVRAIGSNPAQFPTARPIPAQQLGWALCVPREAEVDERVIISPVLPWLNDEVATLNWTFTDLQPRATRGSGSFTESWSLPGTKCLMAGGTTEGGTGISLEGLLKVGDFSPELISFTIQHDTWSAGGRNYVDFYGIAGSPEERLLLRARGLLLRVYDSGGTLLQEWPIGFRGNPGENPQNWTGSVWTRGEAELAEELLEQQTQVHFGLLSTQSSSRSTVFITR